MIIKINNFSGIQNKKYLRDRLNYLKYESKKVFVPTYFWVKLNFFFFMNLQLSFLILSVTFFR